MSRKVRKIEKIFKVFCEGDTEYNYINEMRKQLKLSIALKPINMKGGGYSNFLDSIRVDSDTNCVAKFIVNELGYRNVDEFKAESKVYNVLNTKGNSVEVMLNSLKSTNCFIVNKYSFNKRMFSMSVETTYNWDKLGYQGSNINEFFEIVLGD